MKMKTTTTIVLDDKEADALFKLLYSMSIEIRQKMGLTQQEGETLSAMFRQWKGAK